MNKTKRILDAIFKALKMPTFGEVDELRKELLQARDAATALADKENCIVISADYTRLNNILFQPGTRVYVAAGTRNVSIADCKWIQID